jgi:hypothetical protein
MEARLRRLERWNKALTVGLLLCLAPWLLGAAEGIAELLVVKTVATQALVLTGDATASPPEKRMTMVADDNATALLFLDHLGRNRIGMGILKHRTKGEVPFLLLTDRQGRQGMFTLGNNGQIALEDLR